MTFGEQTGENLRFRSRAAVAGVLTLLMPLAACSNADEKAAIEPPSTMAPATMPTMPSLDDFDGTTQSSVTMRASAAINCNDSLINTQAPTDRVKQTESWGVIYNAPPDIVGYTPPFDNLIIGEADTFSRTVHDFHFVRGWEVALNRKNDVYSVFEVMIAPELSAPLNLGRKLVDQFSQQEAFLPQAYTNWGMVLSMVFADRTPSDISLDAPDERWLTDQPGLIVSVRCVDDASPDATPTL